MMEPWYEGLKELGLLHLGRRLNEDGIKAYKVSEVVRKCRSAVHQILLPQGRGTQ